MALPLTFLALGFMLQPLTRPGPASMAVTMNEAVPPRWRAPSKTKPVVEPAAEEIRSWLDAEVAEEESKAAPEAEVAPKAVEKTAEVAAVTALKVAGKLADVDWGEMGRKAASTVKSVDVSKVQDAASTLKTMADETKKRATDVSTTEAFSAISLTGRALLELGVEAVTPAMDAVKDTLATEATKRLVQRLTDAQKTELLLAKLADGTPISNQDIVTALKAPDAATKGKPTKALPGRK